MSEREANVRAVDEVSPKVREVALRIAALMEGSNYQKLLEVMKRHEEWQEWLDRLPESSRILYQNQIPLHKDRDILLRMICGGSFGVQREKEDLAIQNTIRLLNVKLEVLTEEAREKYNAASKPPQCALPGTPASVCRAVTVDGLITCYLPGCPYNPPIQVQ